MSPEELKLLHALLSNWILNNPCISTSESWAGICETKLLVETDIRRLEPGWMPLRHLPSGKQA